MKKMAVLLVLLVLIGGMLYSTLSKKEETQTGAETTANKTVTRKEIEPKTEQETQRVEIGVQEGKKAPDFTLETLDGKTMHLSDLRGKIVILNIWATWCPPCREEIPDMVKFYRAYKEKNVEILAVNLTETESSVPNVKRFAQGMNMQFPVLLDRKSHVADMYQVTIVPTSFIIDADGIIRQHVMGPMTYSTMEKFIENIKQK
ncbi:TlpA disulfide reductase family protein [Aneurinibacillus thermoaerophilus]|uniref:Peroxiredoxin n=1 Tax=Aneurinibacillus thermoaerophilus TaxID=143495 RepID=A0A1G7X7D6_ANETH|nr:MULTISPECIES: TlpA disulfide reductase family protein [Aneurinibacillus]AMA73239.1 hypothetical protein ACH33_10455 [Aneurinibacillus sp. XH2]MED0756970.1 TlpA disulfide reductase family protein [Aneurinibacillus thermoaerophilus]MED0761725.1 TlpA disulfide reductase family protein [Aneurinibacillus thermoaerophilus]QYY44204.1 TlpA family protein disulfide reductase [Aneurinibacillus thermoaerophilus]SDG80108.1 Peroxiredoxin [Aneurinibacillus thermoaerophilus]